MAPPLPPRTEDTNELINSYGNTANSSTSSYDEGYTDGLMWCLNLGRHSCGEFSMAVVQANTELQSCSQVETGSNAILVGVYDGHHGADAARFISDNFMSHLIGSAKISGNINEENIREAIRSTEEGFLSKVEITQENKPKIAVIGSSFLLGLVWRDELFVAQVGISSCLIHQIDILGKRLHSVNISSERHVVLNSHQHDPNFVVRCDDGKWRIKGVTARSRSIGDACLKRTDVAVHPTLEEFQLSSPLVEPGLSSEPFLHSRYIWSFDKYMIFASLGFWKHVKIPKAKEIIDKHPRQGIARRLLIKAQKVAASKAGITYTQLCGIPRGPSRRAIHGDMSVIVVFIDHDLIVGIKDTELEQRSFKGFTDAIPSLFNEIDDLQENYF